MTPRRCGARWRRRADERGAAAEPGAGGRPSGVRGADRVVSRTASAALLPDRRIGAGRGGSRAGDAAGGMARARALRRQRAVPVLRDVLAFRASEVAEMLGVSEVSVNRALQRARLTLDRAVAPGERDAAPLPRSLHERELVARFASAFQAGDVEGVVAL